jgi:antitoxin HigA-1
VTDRPLPHPIGVPLRSPMHPGQFLARNFLQPLAISQTRAARLLGISRRRVNELVMGHRGMSTDTAIRCALAFGLPTSHWLALQAQWDSWHAWRALRRSH